jgi:hypothetical protein
MFVNEKADYAISVMQHYYLALMEKIRFFVVTFDLDCFGQDAFETTEEHFSPFTANIIFFFNLMD